MLQRGNVQDFAGFQGECTEALPIWRRSVRRSWWAWVNTMLLTQANPLSLRLPLEGGEALEHPHPRFLGDVRAPGAARRISGRLLPGPVPQRLLASEDQRLQGLRVRARAQLEQLSKDSAAMVTSLLGVRALRKLESRVLAVLLAELTHHCTCLRALSQPQLGLDQDQRIALVGRFDSVQRLAQFTASR